MKRWWNVEAGLSHLTSIQPLSQSQKPSNRVSLNDQKLYEQYNMKQSSNYISSRFWPAQGPLLDFLKNVAGLRLVLSTLRSKTSSL
jgi:hypothetical protein